MSDTKKPSGTKHINLAKALKGTQSKGLRRLPKTIVKILERFIYQDQINAVINKYIDFTGVSFHPEVIKEFNIKLDIRGIENMPEHSRCFFTANHPFGVIDGLVLGYQVGRKYGDLRAIGNESFLYVPNLRPLIAAVNVFGKSSREYIEALNEVYNSDVAIAHFPAGEVSRVYDGKIQDSPWQKSFVTKAISAHRDVVPCYFAGTNSRLFYLVFRFRKLTGIKTNLELALLPREMFKKRNKTIRLIIGKPIPWSRFDKSMTHHEWAQKVRQHVYKMGETDQEITF
ncbi:MAG: glycerol acyltransferase [Bacteroidales bacterium]|nr:glycerol acyltransferase [Bacteroidales bacterium]